MKASKFLPYLIVIIIFAAFGYRSYRKVQKLDQFGTAIVKEIGFGRKAKIDYFFVVDGRKFTGKEHTYLDRELVDYEQFIVAYQSDDPDNNSLIFGLEASDSLLDSLQLNSDPSHYLNWFNY